LPLTVCVYSLKLLRPTERIAAAQENERFRRPQWTVFGEFSENDFRNHVRTGVILPSDHYFCEGFKEWKSVADFKRNRFFWGKFAGGAGKERFAAHFVVS
jgi:hypothetical protein